MSGAVVRLITWRGQDLALVQMDQPVTTALAAEWMNAWARGVDQGAVLFPGGWTVQDDRDPRP